MRLFSAAVSRLASYVLAQQQRQTLVPLLRLAIAPLLLSLPRETDHLLLGIVLLGVWPTRLSHWGSAHRARYPKASVSAPGAVSDSAVG